MPETQSKARQVEREGRERERKCESKREKACDRFEEREIERETDRQRERGESTEHV